MTDAPSALDVVDERAAAVATAPRITKKQIEDSIVDVVHLTLDAIAPEEKKDYFAHLTVCILRVQNGFMVIGKSAPMHPANFNAELGKQLAYEDAFRQLWPLYAFASLEDDWNYEQPTSMLTNE